MKVIKTAQYQTQTVSGLHFVKSKADLDRILMEGFKPGPGMGNFVSFYHEGQRPRDFGIGRPLAVIIEFDQTKGGNPKYEGGIQAHDIKSIRQATPEEIANWGKPVKQAMARFSKPELEAFGYRFIVKNELPVLLDIEVHFGQRMVAKAWFTQSEKHIRFELGNTELDPINDHQMWIASVWTDANHRRKGLASAIYQLAEETSGCQIVRTPARTPDSDAMWQQPNRPFGKNAQGNPSQKWYHGTSRELAQKILAMPKPMLIPGQPTSYTRDIPRKNAVYITNDFNTANYYAMTSGGVVLEVQPPDPNKLLPDEDDLWELLNNPTTPLAQELKQLWFQDYMKENAELHEAYPEEQPQSPEDAWQMYVNQAEESDIEGGSFASMEMIAMLDKLVQTHPHLAQQIIQSSGKAAHLGPIPVLGIAKPKNAQGNPPQNPQ